MREGKEGRVGLATSVGSRGWVRVAKGVRMRLYSH